MPIQAVTLDAGGTLLCEVPSRSEIYAQAARRRGLEVTDAAMSHWMHRTHEQLPLEQNGGFRYSDAWFRTFIEQIFCAGLGLGREQLPALQDELFERFSDPATFRLLPGAEPLLRALRSRGIRVGIVSNWGPRLEFIVAGLGLAALVDGLWVSAIEGVEKPDGEIFRRACDGLNVKPGAALHAGDNPGKDVEGARSAGLHAVLVDPDDRHADFPGPRIRHLLELLQCLQDPCHDRS